MYKRQILSSFSFAFGQDAETVKITIIHTNDTHSRLEGSDSVIGFAKIATLIKEAKEANPNTLVLDAGDTLHGMPIVNLSLIHIFQDAFFLLRYGNYDNLYRRHFRRKYQAPVIGMNHYQTAD